MKIKLCVFVLFTLMLAGDAYASKTCWCWIGPQGGNGWVNQGDPVKWIDFGGVASYPNITSYNKKQKCSEACATKATEWFSSNNSQSLCNLINRPVSTEEATKIGAFSLVGAGDWGNNVWDYDAKPINFKGCTRKCNCPKGWYDENRRSCVTGALCDKVPNMPDGDKGGGYWAWHGILFMDIAGGNCLLSPIL
ncbi:MAG TPA: hypothetical protein VF666_01435 [Pyrinomonadaceae bacterium]|jgi:hypothetical protein